MSSPPSYPVHEAEVALDQAESSRSPHDDDSESRLIDVIETIGNVSQWTGDSDGLSMLLQGVNSFVENLPPLVRALDEIAKIHPFVAGTMVSPPHRSALYLQLCPRAMQLPLALSRWSLS